MSGLEILKEIKANPVTKRIPVVVVTSSREDPDIKAAYELECEMHNEINNYWKTKLLKV